MSIKHEAGDMLRTVVNSQLTGLCLIVEALLATLVLKNVAVIPLEAWTASVPVLLY